ncbi:MAG: 30S ribosomal protein S7 [Candidatus Woesearchaeota archaeon]
MNEIKIFNKYSTAGIEIDDMGLKGYISIEPVFVPKTGARYAGRRFHKSKISIVERLINKTMIPGHKGKKHKTSSGHCTGKSQSSYNMIKETFDIIENRTKQNPLAVFVKAVENAAPREEIVTIEYGGARYPKAVEVAPQRRVDLCLRQMTQGAYASSFNSKKSTAQALADEIIAAYNMDTKSTAISKKLELERQADSSR